MIYFVAAVCLDIIDDCVAGDNSEVIGDIISAKTSVGIIAVALEVSPSYIALQIPYGSSAFDNIINLGTKELLNYAHKNNIAVQYWTINSEEEAMTLVQNGADCIITDYPQIVIETVEKCR